MSVSRNDRARGFRAGRGLFGLVAPLLLLGGCASLPISGPTGQQILKEQRDPKSGIRFQLVQVADFADLPVVSTPLPLPIDDAIVRPTSQIGPGDTLAISIYETGVPLFNSSAAAAAAAGGFDGSARATNLVPMRVDDEGYIRLPFVGRMRAAGHTTAELQTMIRNALRGMSQNPNVIVAISDSLSNSVLVRGEVGRSGRLPLSTNRETVGDVISLAGGYRGEPKDLMLRVERQGRTQEFRLSDVMSGPDRDMRARPGDRIDLIRAPLSFTVMGAAGKVDQLPFSSQAMTLAEAVANAGGANPNLGDAKAVFVFRLGTGPDGKPLPTVYHINMMRAGSLFLSQRFAMKDKDVLYVGNAAFNQPAKLTQVVSQLFSPLLMVGSTLNAVQ
jgi:polysaccharide biosynthesis/export protein